MKKTSAPLIATEIGITSLGKYTFPKIFAFFEKVSALLTRQVEKKFQMIAPDMWVSASKRLNIRRMPMASGR